MTEAEKEIRAALEAGFFDDAGRLSEWLPALLAELTSLREERDRLRKGLKPFADAVFNDNGDMTINLGLATSDDYVRAYFAYRRAPRPHPGDEAMKITDEMKNAKVKPLDLSTVLNGAFLAGRGLKDGDKLSAADHDAWMAYDPERMAAYHRICNTITAALAAAVQEGEAKPVGYIVGSFLSERRDEYLNNGTVMYSECSGMATTPVYLLNHIAPTARPSFLPTEDGEFNGNEYAPDAGGWATGDSLTVEEAWTILCETPDITSPEEYPDHALITIEQLGGFMSRAHPAPADAGVVGSRASAVLSAAEGIDDDYMTSKLHHPGYVLIPAAKFEAILSALRTKGGE